MTTLQTIPEVSSRPLTPRQQEVYRLRHEQGATIDQIAQWLKISRRAVFYRLQSAHRRAGRATQVCSDDQDDRGRVYSASQISVAARGDSLNLDEL